jgi:2-polyprenyl-3-methyl-5-hydroxy-6-metoxy-1,4-benzoquinol methylase
LLTVYGPNLASILVNQASSRIIVPELAAPHRERSSPERCEVKKGLSALRPEIPWTHLIDLNGCPTISRRDGGKWLKKAEGLQRFGQIALELCQSIVGGQTLAGKSVLDLGCGEAGHAIMFSQAGAARVVGVEGRLLTAERARFAADVLGLTNVEIIRADVRAINAHEIGSFDVVLCSGILHHINHEQWWPFLKMVGQVTSDLAIFYTHVPNHELQAEHKLRRVEPSMRRHWLKRWSARDMAAALFRPFRRQVERGDHFDGYMFREHRASSTPEERASKMRSSLDNLESFWATEDALIKGLQKAGFQMILKVQSPHMFKSQSLRDTRQIIVAKKAR